MNLIFEKFESFLEVVTEITLTELDKAKELLNNEGKDITNISDIFIGNSNEFFDVLPDGTLVKVNLYIATKSIDKSFLAYISAKDLYKYHIYKCSTISKMFDSGRKHRYKINNRENGTFHYKLFDKTNIKLEERENQELNVCKNCLGQFLNTYPSDDDVKNFNLNKFHQKNSNFFGFDTSKLEKGEESTHNEYSEQWREISTQFKTKKNYTCEKCTWKANNHNQKKFIHTHHKNGDKTNNGKDNLKVLCIECHSNVDEYHRQIKSQSNYNDFIQLKNNPKSVSTPKSIAPKSKKTIQGRPIFAPSFFENPANNKLKLIITNAPIVNGKKTSYTELIILLDSSPKLVLEIWKYLKENKHSFIDNKNQTLALLLINMAEQKGYYSLKRV
jgi:hypothetical protein